jgi:hypothetical protein
MSDSVAGSLVSKMLSPPPRYPVLNTGSCKAGAQSVDPRLNLNTQGGDDKSGKPLKN